MRVQQEGGGRSNSAAGEIEAALRESSRCSAASDTRFVRWRTPARTKGANCAGRNLPIAPQALGQAALEIRGPLSVWGRLQQSARPCRQQLCALMDDPDCASRAKAAGLTQSASSHRAIAIAPALRALWIAPDIL